MNYYIKIGNRAFGPFPEQEIKDLAAQGRINRSSPISNDGMNWRPAGNFSEIYPQGPETASPVAAQLHRETTFPSAPKPAAGMPGVSSVQRLWYVSRDGRSVNGPFTAAEVIGFIQKQSIGPETLVGLRGEKMLPVSQVPYFVEAVRQSRISDQTAAGMDSFTIDTSSGPLQLTQEDADKVNAAFFWFYGVTLAAVVSLVLASIFSIICEGFYCEEGDIPSSGLITLGYIFSYGFYIAYTCSLFLTIPFVSSVWHVAFCSRPEITPNKAACLLLIPVFNLFWQFVVFGKMPQKLNKMLAERKSRTKASSTACFLYCVMNIVALGVPNLIIAPIAFNSLRKASVELVEISLEENSDE